MAPKAYPRTTIKKVVKAHSNSKLARNADVWIYLDYVIFMNRLIKEATIEAKASGERGLTAKSVRKATEGTLDKFRG